MTTPATCRACHAPLDAAARYCHRCGRAVTSGVGERAPWIVAWAFVAIALAGIAWFVLGRSAGPSAPDMANAGNASGAPGAGAGGGQPPDITQMTPRERFLRLHDRIMSAAAGGDTATALRFAPMALQAYGMLDRIDADARYHAGAIHVQLGQYPEALALADTIQADAPRHLLGSLLRLEVAQARRNQAEAARARTTFLADFDTELKTGRPEYQEHRAMLDDLRQRLGRE